MRTILALLLTLSALAAPHAVAAPPNAVLLDRLAAVVGSEVIIASEVEFECRLALVLRGGALGASAPIDDELRKSVLQEMIIRALLYSETKRLRAFDSPAQEQRAINAYKAALMLSLGPLWSETLKEFGLSDAELNEYAKRRVYSERLLSERVSSPPSEDEISSFFQAHPELFGGKSLREVHEQAAGLAQKNLTKERLVRYVDELKGRFPVRILLFKA